MKKGFYDGHESMENGGKSYVDRRTYVREWTVRFHLVMHTCYKEYSRSKPHRHTPSELSKIYNLVFIFNKLCIRVYTTIVVDPSIPLPTIFVCYTSYQSHRTLIE